VQNGILPHSRGKYSRPISVATSLTISRLTAAYFMPDIQNAERHCVVISNKLSVVRGVGRPRRPILSLA